jgi:hypothetical protein
MTLNEAAFQRAWGRAPSGASVERLRRLQEALGIGENDGLVTIAMVLEFYDELYREYPDQCAEAARHALQDGLSSAATLCVGAVQQAIEQRLASFEPRFVIAAKRAVREELGMARVLPSSIGLPQLRSPDLTWGRMLTSWLAYSALLGLVCWCAGSTHREWVALAGSAAGFAGTAFLTRTLWR